MARPREPRSAALAAATAIHRSRSRTTRRAATDPAIIPAAMLSGTIRKAAIACPYSGIRPCFFGGLSSRFVASASSAATRYRRVSAGSMMSSTSRRAARYIWIRESIPV